MLLPACLAAGTVFGCASAGKPDSSQPVQAAVAAVEIDPLAFSRGEKVFRKRGCNACHGIGEYFGKCPDLAGVMERRQPGWLRSWLKDPGQMRQTDSYARELSDRYEAVMPATGITDSEIDDLLVYLRVNGKIPGIH